MRNKIYFTWIISIILAGPVFAEECGTRPALPLLPEGAMAGPEEMKAGKDVTAHFTAASEEYASCLVALAQKNEDQLSRLVAKVSSAEMELNKIVESLRAIEGRRDGLLAEAQAAVDERNVLVKKWNQEAKSFRARLED